MKIIFLDIDGVMNNAETHGSAHHHTWTGWAFTGLDRRLVKKLNQLVTATGADIVLSSTWRKHFTPEEMHDRLVSAGMNPAIKIVDRTPVLHKPRHYEISAWLDAFSGKVEQYVILDDDYAAGIRGHFVNTNNYVGLTDEDVKAAIEILARG